MIQYALRLDRKGGINEKRRVDKENKARRRLLKLRSDEELHEEVKLVKWAIKMLAKFRGMM